MVKEQDNLRVALVGCGQIADAHLQEIRKIPGVELVGVCDQLVPLAEQAAARFGIQGVFTNVSELLCTARPQVLHVTTPPHTHRPIALAAFAAGAHAYIEKPFSLDAAEADEILAAAAAAGVKVCVGHDQLFDPIWQECRRIYDRGELGRIVHVESIQGYDLSGPFGQLLAEPDHWLHRLPGGLFQNTISHALYKITDFLTDDAPQIMAQWRDLHRIGSPTDLRATLWGADVTGNLVFTTLAKPLQRVVRLFGTRQILEVDFDAQIVRRSRPASMPGAFAKLELPYRQWREAGGWLMRNVRRFLRSDIHYFAGMRALFTAFYESIRQDRPGPIPPQEIRRVTAIMDDIFAQCRQREGGRQEVDPAAAAGAPTMRREMVERITHRSGNGEVAA
jgi:predicted dehydrogenase